MALRHRLRAAASSARWRATAASRGVLAVEGADARKVLQGLVTNDIGQLDAGPQYAGFLTPQGRLLADAFMVAKSSDSVMLDVDREALPALAKHISRYRLRSKAKVRDISDEMVVVVTTAAEADAESTAAGEGGAWADPRLPQLLAHRVLCARDVALPPWLMQAGVDEVGEELHALQEQLLGVPGSMDAEALPLESNLELMHGVSFTKGCYLGQELTARTHFRGVVRKRLLPVVDATRPAADGPVPDDSGAMAAFARLPEAEVRVAAALLFDDAEGVGAAVQAGKQTLHNAATGKKVGSLRAYEPETGLGMALCNVDVLAGGAEGGPAELKTASDGEDAAALPTFRPLRPSWWPTIEDEEDGA